MTSAFDTFSGAATRPLLRVTVRGNDGGPDRVPSHVTAPARTATLRAEQALRLLAGFGALRRDQLEGLLLGDERLAAASRRVAAYRAVAALRDRALVQTVGLPGGGNSAPRGYVLTPTGHRVYAANDPAYPRRRTTRALSVVLLDHAIALADIAIALRDAAAHARNVALVWESDWEAIARIGCAVAIPDALVTLEREGWRTRAFIEADRSTERHQAFAEKVRRYVEVYRRDEWRGAMSTWPLILTVTTSDAHARSLARLAHRVAIADGGCRIAGAFRFTSVDEIRASGALASIWHLGESSDRVSILDAPAGRGSGASV